MWCFPDACWAMFAAFRPSAAISCPVDIEAKVRQEVAHMRHAGRRALRAAFRPPAAIYIEVNYKPLDNGMIVSIHRDITALKEREDALAARQGGPPRAARAGPPRSTRRVMQDRAR